MCLTSADYPTWYINCYGIYFGCGLVGSIHYLCYLLHFIPAKTTHKSVKTRELYLRTDIYQGLSKQSHRKSAATILSNSQTETENVQTVTEDVPFEMVENKTMVAPATRDAPKFDSKKPQEVRRFLLRMEDLLKEAGIKDDAEKKVSLGKYADKDSEEEWKALETYESGNTWEEFKDELLENYPEAAAAERGTPMRIRQVCYDARGI